MRPSSGDTYVRGLLHWALIRSKFTSIAFVSFFMFLPFIFFPFLQCGYLLQCITCILLIHFTTVVRLHFCVSTCCIFVLLFCWCARDCMFQMCLYVHCIDSWCNCTRLYIFVSIKCAAIYRKARVPFEIWDYALRYMYHSHVNCFY
jgi:hypothetical protein